MATDLGILIMLHLEYLWCTILGLLFPIKRAVTDSLCGFDISRTIIW